MVELLLCTYTCISVAENAKDVLAPADPLGLALGRSPDSRQTQPAGF